MQKYHVNPETGEPGFCSAMVRCPYGDIASQHFETPEAARAAYEDQMDAYEEYINTPLGKIDAFANKLRKGAKKAFAKAIRWMDNRPGWVFAGFTAISTVAGLILMAKLTGSPFGAPAFVVGGVTGVFAGVTSGFLANVKIDSLRKWIDKRSKMPHEERFGLIGK